LCTLFTAICSSFSEFAVITWSSAYSIVWITFPEVTWIPFWVVCFHSCIILLIYMLNNSGDSPHPRLTPLLTLIGSETGPSLYFMRIFEFWYRLCIAFKSCVGMFSSLRICHSFCRFKLSYAFQRIYLLSVNTLLHMTKQDTKLSRRQNAIESSRTIGDVTYRVTSYRFGDCLCLHHSDDGGRDSHRNIRCHSHSGEYEENCLLGCCAVYCRRNWPTFQRW
jgi:hypothetical protein